ncbi:hypothetical protein D3C77_212340 [compost metagenome]
MIVEKIFDTVYEEASRFITKWRGVSFFVAWVLVSGAFVKFADLGFWVEGAGQVGSSFISSLLELSFYKLLYLILSAFYISPVISNSVALFIIKVELGRAQVLIDSVESVVINVQESKLFEALDAARKGAIKAEEELQVKKAINEAYAFSLLVLAFVCLFGDVNIGWLVFFSIPWPFLVFLLSQEMLVLYISKILLFKKLSRRAGMTVLE